MRKLVVAFAIVVAVGTQAFAHKLIRPGVRDDIAKNAFSATPKVEWNRLGEREGKYQEIWTLDGDKLNKVTFFGGVPVGQPLFKEADKKREPLPKVTAGMLITDIPVILEHSYRAQGRTNKMSIGIQEPVTIDGKQGIRFDYTYVYGEDTVERRGEALGTLVGGKLFLVTYEAPSLYFFDKDLGNFRQLVESLKIKG